MKIIVTGCAGMIGCHLMARLLELFPKEEDQIIGIDDLSRGSIKNLQEACIKNKKKFEFIKADLSIYEESWVKNFRNVDIVIHLADIVASVDLFLIMSRLSLGRIY